MQLTMKDVMTANCQISNEAMLTSNHCAALARELNSMLAATTAPPRSGAHAVAWLTSDGRQLVFDGVLDQSQYIEQGMRPLSHADDAGEVDRLNTVVEQQKNLIAALRADLRDSYSIDAAVQEEHLDLEAAAKKLAACMDYPWEHMPEQGRASMREHATAVIGAALGSKQ